MTMHPLEQSGAMSVAVQPRASTLPLHDGWTGAAITIPIGRRSREASLHALYSAHAAPLGGPSDARDPMLDKKGLNSTEARLLTDTLRWVKGNYAGKDRVILSHLINILLLVERGNVRDDPHIPAAAHSIGAAKNLAKAGCIDINELGIAISHDFEEQYPRHLGGRQKMKELLVELRVPKTIRSGIGILTSPCHTNFPGSTVEEQKQGALFEYLRILRTAPERELRVKIAEATDNIPSIDRSPEHRLRSRVTKMIAYKSIFDQRIRDDDRVGQNLLREFNLAFFRSTEITKRLHQQGL